MTDLQITFCADITEIEKALVLEYWQLENNKFINSVTALGKTYSLTINQINKVVKTKSSYEIIIGVCKDCKNVITKIVYLRSSYSNSFKENKRCNGCEIIYQKKIRDEYEQRWQQAEQEKQLKLDSVITNKLWQKLDIEELDILKQIMDCITLPKIKKNVYKGDFFDNKIWNVVKRLEKFNLLEVERSYTGVVDFHFDERVKKIIFAESSSCIKKSDKFSFSLAKKNNRTKADDPMYSGTFILPDQIILEKGEKYVYAGWLQSDGSINFKFTPAKYLSDSKPVYGDIENEPKIVKDIIDDMYNNLDDQDKQDDQDDQDDSPF